MKKLVVFAVVVLLGQIEFAQGGLFKCTSAEGGVSYQETPCQDSENTTSLNVGSSNSENDAVDATTAGSRSVVGSWSSGTSKYRISISASGKIRLNDGRGGIMNGSWKKTGDNKYEVDASFQGQSIPVRMRMDEQSGELLLSVAGMGSQRYK